MGIPQTHTETPQERMRRQAAEIRMTLRDPQTGIEFSSQADADVYARDLEEAARRMDAGTTETRRESRVPRESGVVDVHTLPPEEQKFYRDIGRGTIH
jgi:hypothetical protein